MRCNPYNDCCIKMILRMIVLRALVVGYGSIGSRHARLLTELGMRVAVVSHRDVNQYRTYKTISAALKAEDPEYVVIANKTNEHFDALMQFIDYGFSGNVLIEKPLFDKTQKIPKHNLKGIFTAYNLRFHPIIQGLHRILRGAKPLSMQVYVGQYLPHWRPEIDYRKNYSANRAEGGGVLRDLSHELDYLIWMLGGWEKVVAIGGHYSNLQIDSEDVVSIIFAARNCPVVSVQLNYLDRSYRREIIVNTDDFTVYANLISGILRVNDQTEYYRVHRDYTYRAQHRAVINNELDSLCTAEEGLEIVRFIESIEQSIINESWVKK